MENEKPILRGELALMAAIVINSFSVVLMLYSGSGISAISSVPYAFSEVFKSLSLGTWTYIFQGALVLSLMILRRKFVPSYLFSFVAGFAFSELLDVNELWIGILPQTIPARNRLWQDRDPATDDSVQDCIFSDQLFLIKYRNCFREQMPASDHSNGFISKRTVIDH